MLRSSLKVRVGLPTLLGQRSDAGPLPGELVVKHTFLEFVEVATPVDRMRLRASTDSALFHMDGGAYADERRARRGYEPDASPTICEHEGDDHDHSGAEAPEDSREDEGTKDAKSTETVAEDAQADASTDESADGADPTHTTLMMRNLPNNYTRSMLLMMLDSHGFAGCYNFVYLPIDFGSSANLGYAFINLVDARVVQRFWDQFAGFLDWDIPSSKICHVDWSGPHQGLEAHIERYRNSPMMHKCVPDAYKPVLFEGGVRVPFPAPTKALQPPRARRPDAHGGRRRFMVVTEPSPTEARDRR